MLQKFRNPYCSSSASNRAIRHYEAKNGKSSFITEKIDNGVFLIVPKSELTFKTFSETTPKFVNNGIEYKYFPDGVSGDGYYELKTGNRRRPNSMFFTMIEAYLIVKQKQNNPE